MCTFAPTESATLPVRSAHQGGTFILYGMSSAYSNNPLSIRDIIKMLKEQRGLLFEDENKAERQLSIIGYFRMANYLRPMEADKMNHLFKPKSTFENALRLYYFDKALRALLFTAIQSVEIGIRAQISHPIALKHGAFWYSDPDLCVDKRLCQDNKTGIQREVARSKEDFIKEHFLKYPDSDLPSWKILEVVSFGMLSKIFSNLSDFALKKTIARNIGLPQHKILENWLQSLSALRNCVAHHSRIWNRVFPGTPTLPNKMSNKWISNTAIDTTRLYAHLCCIAYLQNQIHPDNDFANKLKVLLSNNPNVDLSAMGFPADWQNEPLWR